MAKTCKLMMFFIIVHKNNNNNKVTLRTLEVNSRGQKGFIGCPYFVVDTMKNVLTYTNLIFENSSIY